MLYFLVGFLVGTLTDYLIHRLIGHGPGSEASDAQLLSHHSLAHHKVFTDRRGMTARRGETRRSHVHLQLRAAFILVLLIAVAVGVGMSVGGVLGVDAPEPFLWMGGGLALALVMYEVLHTLHHTQLPDWLTDMPGYRQAREWHHQHHRVPDSRFGVVLPLWDFVFFTHHGLTEDEAEEEAPEGRARPTTRPRTAQRKRPSTTMEGLLAATMAEAEAEADDDVTGTQRKKRRRGPTTSSGSQGASTGRSKRPTTRKEAGTSKKKRPVKASWLNVMSTEDEIDGIKVEAVHEEED